jgi:predicted phage terminase large subunit-like protein
LVVTPDKLEWMCMSWDLAFKDTKKSDFVAGHVWGGRGADRVMLDRVHGRMNFTATVNAIRALAAKWPKARAKYVEDKANGPAVIQVLEKEIPGLIAVNPEGGKVARAYAVSPEIESGNVYLPYGAPWASDFIQECAGFPNAKNDDDVDAMTQALIRMSLDRQALVRARKLATL